MDDDTYHSIADDCLQSTIEHIIFQVFWSGGLVLFTGPFHFKRKFMIFYTFLAYLVPQHIYLPSFVRFFLLGIILHMHNTDM